MKVLSLISTALFALSLAGAVQAAPAAPAAKANVATATIVLAHCEENATAPCSMDAPAHTGENDPNTLPPASHQKQAQAEPATPVPEPQTCVMLMLGLVVLGFATRRNSSSEKFSD
ncbi:PEP-CTERM sorting domain-containing protein [Duganella sp. FT80W]|uniref:PEP-CTERM sorting domain-containing protein n=2 Tax=Duganella guangzhouensis TaxID=2666084 RepID=A0A6I2L4J7_9BURK|nr:PEP-CTERM sorting domain-containing protein [Duganella guangzhouensis]